MLFDRYGDGVFRALVQLRQPANRREVVGRALEHLLELDLRLVVAAEVEQRPAERHARRQMIRKLLEAIAAERYGALEIAGPAESLGDAAKRGRLIGGDLPAAIHHQ